MALSQFGLREEMSGANIAYPANTYSSIYTNNIRKSGNVATINFNAALSGTLAGSGAVVCTLPEGYRPSSSSIIGIYTTYGGGSTKEFYTGTLSTNGNITTNIGSLTISGSVRIQTTIIL